MEGGGETTKTTILRYRPFCFQIVTLSYIIQGLQHRFKKSYRCLAHEPVLSSKTEMHRDPQATQKAEAKYLHH